MSDTTQRGEYESDGVEKDTRHSHNVQVTLIIMSDRDYAFVAFLVDDFFFGDFVDFFFGDLVDFFDAAFFVFGAAFFTAGVFVLVTVIRGAAAVFGLEVLGLATADAAVFPPTRNDCPC